jgi:cholesterol oxidase
MSWDFVIIGSGFGGSVSALRLAEKGYRVLVLERGRRFGPDDFPRTNWDVSRWLWQPQAGLKGIFQMSFLPHLTVLHGVGVGGGSLVYANTLPTPKDNFFLADSWRHLADWKSELGPHYATARRMLGATPNPRVTPADEILRQIGKDLGREEHFHPTEVAVYFGQPGKRVADPYFGGAGPDRTGCIFCGACMTGCRHGAKNTLDQNYLWLAEKKGVTVRAETDVVAVRPRATGGGYVVELAGGDAVPAARVIFSGGVMGTLPLLLKMREDPKGLPLLSPRLGEMVRTNSEALIGVIVPDPAEPLSHGVAISSILHTDEHSHIEPCRYGAGSGFFRTLVMPHAPAPTVFGRLASVGRSLMRDPLKWARALTVKDFASRSQILLYMRTLEGTLTLKLGRGVTTGGRKGLISTLPAGAPAPKAFMEEATDLGQRFAEKAGGVLVSLATETLLGVPSTAHILGGCVMGADRGEGVIDARHRVFGYDNLWVVDGSAISANPGVNPSLTITALAERAMSQIPAKAS